jgi:hypothetical protein
MKGFIIVALALIFLKHPEVLNQLIAGLLKLLNG